jgi:hypothetical protein
MVNYKILESEYVPGRRFIGYTPKDVLDIKSVMRMSDGKIFSLGDKIVLDKYMMGRKYITIDEIYWNEHDQLSFSTNIGPAPKHFNFGLSDINCRDYKEPYNDFKSIYNSLLRMQEAKDKAYGNSALKPLDIFAKHHNYGARLDEKLARVQNSTELRKNDVADIIGGLVLICKDKGWTNFDDLID